MESLVKLGREWLVNSPPATPSADGLVGWSGPVGFVCHACAGRLMARGCNFKALADTPVWDKKTQPCDLCEGA